jgi:ABC-type glycerol-3-phosphate transport system permease component
VAVAPGGKQAAGIRGSGERKKGSPNFRIPARQLFGYLLLCLVALVFLLPLLWMLSSSLKPEWQVLANPPVWIPNPPR